MAVSVGKAIHIELYIPIQMARKISFFAMVVLVIEE